MQNKDRIFVAAIKDYCRDRGVALSALSGDWIFILRKGGHTHRAIAYDIGLNSSAAHKIAQDKSAACDVLSLAGVPCLEMRLFHAPFMREFIPFAGNWADMLDYFEANGRDVVCKPTDGTGGGDVYRVTSEADLEDAVHRLFQSCRSLCLSPFVSFDREYRVILLDGEPLLIVAKQPASVIGDGQRTVLELLLEKFRQQSGRYPASEIMVDLARQRATMQTVPPAGHRAAAGWKHNLSFGADIALVDADQNSGRRVAAAARRAADAIGLRFCSVDLFETGDDLVIVEVNSGVTMEGVAKRLPDGEALVKGIYARALDRAFEAEV